MNKLVILVATIAMTSAVFAESDAYKMYAMASDLAGGSNSVEVFVDVGKKCGVDARTQENPWFAWIGSSTVNQPRFQAALSAKADGNHSEYNRAIKSIACASK
ncbi:hypothetical protein [Zhongshania marina]|uniref:Uncharacterized protein n=1 Tax=Zhongshania marina TaxID=2304603 RepID=A0A2S4HBY4_9GAMM|nr:hypothetical protein [Marortus luteolus]POP51516.1 hypothetical protein C0068_16390 [Marortus luteolus]